MKAIRWCAAMVLLAAVGCSDDNGVTPDLGSSREASVKTEAGPLPDGTGTPDGSKPDTGPAPDGAKLDGPALDVAKLDGPKTDAPKASYCDVVYRMAGVFKTTDAPLIGQFTKNVGSNATVPSFDPAKTTPFTPTAFTAGFMRLRFPSVNGAPAAGTVRIVEAYMPMEFTVNSLGTNVVTDIDQSAGLLALAGSPLAIGDPPTLSRTCGTVATGTLSGTTLTWAACSAIPDNTTTWTFAKAQSNDPGCMHRMSTYGHVKCTAGFCNLVTGTGNQRQTWDQKLNAFTFSGTNYATATFTMAEVQSPNLTSVKTFLSFAAQSVIKVECDTAAPLTCDEQ